MKPSKRELAAIADEILRSNGSKALCEKRISDPPRIIDINKYLRSPLLKEPSVYVPKAKYVVSLGKRKRLCHRCGGYKSASSWICSACRHNDAVERYHQRRFRANEIRSTKAVGYEYLLHLEEK